MLDYGRLHNEGVLFSILKLREGDDITIGELIDSAATKMEKLRPQLFNKDEVSKIEALFDFDKKINDFKFDEAFYDNIKKVGKVDENLNPKIVSFFDKGFKNNKVYKRDIVNLDLEITNPSIDDFKTIYAVNSLYEGVTKFWRTSAPIDFLPSYSDRVVYECDPEELADFADLCVGLIFSEGGPAGMLLAGWATSTLVRHAQRGPNGKRTCI